MDAETITALSNALSGPASGLFVMGMLLFGIYKVAISLLGPFLTTVAENIKQGFETQTSSLASLVEEIKKDREDHVEMSNRLVKVEEDVTEIKDDINVIKNKVVH